jgi:hypothetical protein
VRLATHVPAHDLDAAAEALIPDLAVQAVGVHAALVPPALQIGLEPVDQTLLRSSSREICEIEHPAASRS